MRLRPRFVRPFCLAAMAALSLQTPLAAADATVIGDRRELFADRALIDSLDGVRLQLARTREAEAVLQFDEPWEHAVNYTTVIKDGDTYRLYYRGVLPEKIDNKSVEVTCYAESTDGVNWVKPELGIYEYQGRPTNVILGPDMAKRVSHNFSPFLDDRPGVPAAERYKGVGGVFHDNSKLVPDPAQASVSGGLYRYISADGIHWELAAPQPILPGYALDSQNVLIWVPSEQQYAIYLRTWSEGGVPGKPTYAGIRTISRSVSKDFKTWSEPERMTFGDAPLEHLYTNGTHPYFRAPHLLVALPFRFWPDRQAYSPEQQIEWGVDPSQAHGVSDAVFMTSRGGLAYDRTFMESFLRPGRDPYAWHARNNSPTLGVVPTGDGEMSFYAVTHYMMPGCFLRRHVVRVDGFSAAHAGYQGGSLLTKPIVYSGAQLDLNFATSAAGSVIVELVDIYGETLATSEPLIGDDIDRTVVWQDRADVAAFAGQAVRLRFILQDADLYAYRFHL